ncbi:Uncharacterised protein [Escherichia coli]|nr:hypothetical protein BvCmsA119A_02359 [Escherichia coli]GCK40015.1 hypothetical protein BvCmsB54A_00906 [Escherichia coli]SQS03238.1 Uncharacterised protein [Escherichia coli]
MNGSKAKRQWSEEEILRVRLTNKDETRKD